MAAIILAKCKEQMVKVLVDEDDFEALSKIKWNVSPSKWGGIQSSQKTSFGVIVQYANYIASRYKGSTFVSQQVRVIENNRPNFSLLWITKKVSSCVTNCVPHKKKPFYSLQLQ